MTCSWWCTARRRRSCGRVIGAWSSSRPPCFLARRATWTRCLALPAGFAEESGAELRQSHRGAVGGLTGYGCLPPQQVPATYFRQDVRTPSGAASGGAKHLFRQDLRTGARSSASLELSAEH